MVEPLTDLSRMCVHTITTKPWSLQECVTKYAKAGIPAVTVWRQWLEPQGAAESAKFIADAGLRVTSLCRGGFFPSTSAAKRQEAIDDNRRAIEEAAAIGAPLVVLVCGADPGQPLAESRQQITDGIAAVLDEAHAANVRLAIEPLHPMYANDRSAVNTMAQANDMAEALDHPAIGVAVDVYHLWWDPALRDEIARCGRNGNLAAFHVCDWLTPTRDFLNDRGLMGDGCINIREIRGWAEQAGFSGDVEVEIFSTEAWATDQDTWLARIITAYREHS